MAVDREKRVWSLEAGGWLEGGDCWVELSITPVR